MKISIEADYGGPSPDVLPVDDGNKKDIDHQGDQYSLAIIDDERVFSATLRLWLENTAGFKVLGEAADTESGWILCRNSPPDVVLVDVGLREGNGFDLVRQLKRNLPQTRVIIVTCRVNPQTAGEAVECGVHGLIDKGSSLKGLLEAIQAVKSGNHFVCAAFQCLREQTRVQSEAMCKILSHQELQLFSYLAAGLSDDEIARNLGVSKLTVICQRSNLRQKLKVPDDRGLSIFKFNRGTFNGPAEME